MSPAPRIWPVPTEVVASYLIDVLDVPVRWSVPNPRPDEFIVLRALGAAGRSQWSEVVVFDFEVWSGQPGDSPRPAAQLAQTLRAALLASASAANPIVDISVGSAVYFPDPESNAPRFLLSADVRLKP